jgi:hypothetical protein
VRDAVIASCTSVAPDPGKVQRAAAISVFHGFVWIAGHAAKAFSSEVDTGSRDENALKQ